MAGARPAPEAQGRRQGDRRVGEVGLEPRVTRGLFTLRSRSPGYQRSFVTGSMQARSRGCGHDAEFWCQQCGALLDRGTHSDTLHHRVEPMERKEVFVKAQS